MDERYSRADIASARSPGQFAESMGVLEKEIDGCDAAVSDLLSRIEPLLGPQSPMNALAQVGEKPRERSPISTKVRGLAERVSAMKARIQERLDMLEL